MDIKNVKPGDTLRCTNSQSCAYTLDKTYVVYRNSEDASCIRGDDGLEDYLSLLLSKFTKV